MDSNKTSQLLFIHPEDPTKSFYYPYEGDEGQNESLGTIQTAIELEKKFSMKFTDAFGRELPKDYKSQDFKPLQPFYITSIIPEFVKVHVTLASSNETVDIEIGSRKALKEVAEHIQQTKGIPMDEQFYFHGESAEKLDLSKSFIDLQLAKEHVDLKMMLKSTIQVDVVGEIVDVKIEPSDGFWRVRRIIAKMKEINENQLMLFRGTEELDLCKSLRKYGIQDQDTITVRWKIEVKVQVMDQEIRIFAAPDMKVEDLKKGIGRSRRGLYLCKDCFDLEYNEAFLDDEKLLCDYVFDTICVGFTAKFRPDTLFIKFPNVFGGETVRIQRNKTIWDVAKVGLGYPELYDIYFKNQKLAHETKLEDLITSEEKSLELSYSHEPTCCQIYIKCMTGKTFSIDVDRSHTILNLKKQLGEKERYQPDRIRLIFAGRQLEDHRTIRDCNINKESTVHLSLRMRGGGPGVKFADITKAGKAKDLEWSTGAPEWRTVTRDGLCLEGKCTNNKCRAYTEWVIICKGIGTYDLVYDQHQNKCPVCDEYVKAEKCAFTNCSYGYSGIVLQDGGKPPKKIISQEEIEVGDCYKLFDPEVAGKANWLTLKIVTKWAGEGVVKSALCGICRKVVEGRGETKECAHLFHDECLQSVKDLNAECVVCHF